MYVELPMLSLTIRCAKRENELLKFYKNKRFPIKIVQKSSV